VDVERSGPASALKAKSVTGLHLDRLLTLVAAEGWTEYSHDPERTYRALTAPGSTTLVAVADGQVVGAIQVRSLGFRLTRESLGLGAAAAE
jgi:hypothetical protein